MIGSSLQVCTKSVNCLFFFFTTIWHVKFSTTASQDSQHSIATSGPGPAPGLDYKLLLTCGCPQTHQRLPLISRSKTSCRKTSSTLFFFFCGINDWLPSFLLSSCLVHLVYRIVMCKIDFYHLKWVFFGVFWPLCLSLLLDTAGK